MPRAFPSRHSRSKISQWRGPGSTATDCSLARRVSVNARASSTVGRGEDARVCDDSQEAAEDDARDSEGLLAFDERRHERAMVGVALQVRAEGADEDVHVRQDHRSPFGPEREEPLEDAHSAGRGPRGGRAGRDPRAGRSLRRLEPAHGPGPSDLRLQLPRPVPVYRGRRGEDSASRA